MFTNEHNALNYSWQSTFGEGRLTGWMKINVTAIKLMFILDYKIINSSIWKDYKNVASKYVFIDFAVPNLLNIWIVMSETPTFTFFLYNLTIICRLCVDVVGSQCFCI